jgi:hypothetical protein
MKVRTLVLVVAWSLAASSACCLAQEPENFPDSTLTAEQWQQRLQDARRRSEEFVANARTRTADPPLSGNTGKEDAEATDQLAMNDPSLQPGDIIATSKGFLVFVGRDSDARQASDFVPAPSPRYQVNPLKAAR